MFLVGERAAFLSLQILKQWVLELDTTIRNSAEMLSQLKVEF